MNNTHSHEEIQDCPDNYNEFLVYLNDLLKKIEKKTKKRIEDAETEMWLYLRKAVIHAFDEYGDLKEANIADLLSNVLLDMDGAFHEILENKYK